MHQDIQYYDGRAQAKRMECNYIVLVSQVVRVVTIDSKSLKSSKDSTCMNPILLSVLIKLLVLLFWCGTGPLSMSLETSRHRRFVLIKKTLLEKSKFERGVVHSIEVDELSYLQRCRLQGPFE
jgi:hypothetical protein